MNCTVLYKDKDYDITVKGFKNITEAEDFIQDKTEDDECYEPRIMVDYPIIQQQEETIKLLRSLLESFANDFKVKRL